MKRVVIIGATSAIAEAVGRILAQRNAALFLVARDGDRVEAIAEDLLLRGAVRAAVHRLDINDLPAHETMFASALRALGGPIDVVLVAHGTLPDQMACEASPTAAVQELQTNAASTIALLLRVANRLVEQGMASTLAVITSVAGERGRRSNYVYGAAKAAVSTFLSGLRQRLHSEGIVVLDIKPGFVITPMTQRFHQNRLWARPEDVARGIVRAIDQGDSIVYLPRFWGLIMWAVRKVPECLFKRLRF